MDPTSAPALLYRGLTRLRMEKESAALEDLAMALVRDPTCVEAAWARARVFAVRQQWAEAARDFGRVIALKPDDDTAVACRGEARFHFADWPGCLADYRRALALAPTDYKHLNRLAWVLATCPEARFRNPAEAVSLAQAANQIAGGRDPLVVDTLEVALGAARDASREKL